MSLILDALRKSEQERRQADSPVFAPPIADSAVMPRRRPGVMAAAVAAVVVAVAAVAYRISFLVPERPAPVAAVASATAAAPAPASAPNVAATPNPATPPAPELTVNPFVAAAGGGEVRDLAAEARVERPPPRPAPVRVARASPPASAPAVATETTIPFLRAMPPEFQRELSDLVVNIHIYAPREDDRILYINNRQYHAGDTVRHGVVVEEIVEDGAVLRYQGRRFKLPRPS